MLWFIAFLVKQFDQELPKKPPKNPFFFGLSWTHSSFKKFKELLSYLEIEGIKSFKLLSKGFGAFGSFIPYFVLIESYLF